jgi:F420-non-reducing hydrogenase iron-sulfur subunit
VEIMQDSAGITVFVCANCARPGKQPAAAVKSRPVVPNFNLPGRVQQIVIPCTGRLQPEHVLKAFESGSSVVSVVACREDNCHFIEGSRRCALRVDYIRSILKEIGLGEGRLVLSYLPGSATEDLALSTGKIAPGNHSESLETQIAAIRDQVIDVLRTYPPSPLQDSAQVVLSEDSLREELDLGEEGEDE